MIKKKKKKGRRAWKPDHQSSLQIPLHGTAVGSKSIDPSTHLPIT